MRKAFHLTGNFTCEVLSRSEGGRKGEMSHSGWVVWQNTRTWHGMMIPPVGFVLTTSTKDWSTWQTLKSSTDGRAVLECTLDALPTWYLVGSPSTYFYFIQYPVQSVFSANASVFFGTPSAFKRVDLHGTRRLQRRSIAGEGLTTSAILAVPSAAKRTLGLFRSCP